MQTPNRRIDSLPELRRRVPVILEQINADPSLALRAAANPLLALEEIGYDLSPELRTEVEQRVRFPEATRERMTELANKIHAAVPGRFDLDEPEDVARLLFDELQLPPLPQRVPLSTGKLQQVEDIRPKPRPKLHPLAPPFARPGGPRPVDVIEPLRDAHPVVPMLLEYRALQASSPPLAPPALYKRIARGEAEIPKLRIRARLQRRPETP